MKDNSFQAAIKSYLDERAKADELFAKAYNITDMKEKRMVSVLIPKDGFTGLIAQKTGRNKVCPCGSGKKAKKCCGADTKYYSRQPCDSETSEDRKRRFDGIK